MLDLIEKKALPLLERLAAAVERAVPPVEKPVDIYSADAFVWQAENHRLHAVNEVNRVEASLLKGIDHVTSILFENTLQFAKGFPANNALLWGARGMGKSSLVKAAHAETNAKLPDDRLVLIEIAREDIGTLPQLLTLLKNVKRRFIVFCDDLSFDNHETSYKALKSVLEGGIEGRPDNVIFYATSNRRHLMPRDMVENESGTAIFPDEAVQEKLSLSDRFGLWLGFHPCPQDVYYDMVEHYARAFELDVPVKELRQRANEWSMTRGARSGRVAWQFIQDLAGKMGRKID